MSYSISSIEQIDGEAAKALRAAGIRSTARLLESACTVTKRRLLADKTGIDTKTLLCWANCADRMRIRGVNKEYAELLAAAGATTIRDIKYRNPENLAKAIAVANKKLKLVRLVPSEKVVSRWIEAAKELSPKIKY
jgi:hypothetical protein